MTDQLAPSPAPFWRGPRGVTPWWMIERRRRRTRLALGIAVVALAFVAALTMLTLRARTNYLAGERALAAGAYEDAIARFSAAEVVGVPYPHARAALTRAAALAQIHAERTTALLDGPALNDTSRQLRQAVRLFATRRYDEALAALPGQMATVPAAVLAARRSTGRPAFVALMLLAAAERDFAAGSWAHAFHDAQAVLVRAPDCGPAVSLASRAATRMRARPAVLRAQWYARHGQWRLAVRSAQRALAIDDSYPGVAGLLAYYQSRVPHKRTKAAATKTAVAAPTNSTTSGASGTTTTSPSPPAPKPKPSPTPPPP